MKKNKQRFVTIPVVALVLCLGLTACKNEIGDMPGGNNSAPGVSTAMDTPDSNDSMAAKGISISEGIMVAKTPGTAFTPGGMLSGGNDIKPESGNEAEIDYRKAYDALINQWKSALDSYKSGEYTEKDVLDFIFYDNSDPSSAEAYYALFDIDGNGILELLLSKRNSAEDITAYIFTLEDGETINLFGYSDKDIPIEVPWSRVGASNILSNGLIDSMDGDGAIYKIADDGHSIAKIAFAEPAEYPDMASLEEAEWKYFVNGEEEAYDFYVQYLDTQGYTVDGKNTLASIAWKSIG